LLIAFKLSAIELGWWIYLTAGIGCALIVGGIIFLFIHPDDKKVARHMDEQHDLEEKVQTMLEFSGTEGSVVQLQRENTEQALAKLKKPRVKALTALKYAVISIISVGVFVTGLVIPQRRIEPYTPPDDFEMTNWQAAALQQLINEVKSSSLEEDVKNSTVAVLQNLLDGLEQTEQESVMKVAVNSAIELIDGITTSKNSYSKLSSRLIENDHTEAFGIALNSAATCYKTSSTKISTYETVQTKESTLYDSINVILAECAQNVSAATEGKSGGPFRTAIDNYVNGFNTALTASELQAGEGLYDTFKNYCDNLNTVRSHSQVGGYSTLQTEIESAGTTFAQEGATALKAEAYNCLMNDYISTALKDIFGIVDSSSDNSSGSDASTDDTNGSDDDTTAGGSYGSGDKNYGSDDTIFYPDKGEYVKYGEVLETYSKLMRK
jgi:hypothetical protein